jgi:hypothetical protein
VVEEVSDEAEVRQSSCSLLSAAASFRRPALTVAVLGAAAVIVVVARHTGLHSSAALAAVVAYRFISFWLVLLGGWVAFIVLARPLRRRRGR